MKLATFEDDLGVRRAGALVGGMLVELSQAARVLDEPPEGLGDMVDIIDMDALAGRVARRIVETLERAIAEGSGMPSGIVRHYPETIRFLPPIPRPGKFLAVGANYRTHRDEIRAVPDPVAGSAHGGLISADTPPAFAKFPSTMIGHRESIVYPEWTSQLDYEAELTFIIGRRCKNVQRAHWRSVVAGYTITNDVSMRDIQRMEMGRGITTMGKNLDTSAPVGPYIVTADEIADPQNLRIRTWVNGELRQDERSSQMIFDIPAILEYWSRMTLEPGDMFTTGTPGGVAIFSDDPERNLLQPGDDVVIEIEGIGRLANSVVR